MFNRKSITGLIVIIFIMTLANLAADSSPLQLALFNPIQLVPEGNAISGIRLNIYGKNISLSGVDIGIINHLGTGDSKGLELGTVNFIEGNFYGIQWGDLCNYTTQNFQGFQMAPINYARNMNGFQLGFLNYCENMIGLQIGIINIIHNGGILPIMPIINWNF